MSDEQEYTIEVRKDDDGTYSVWGERPPWVGGGHMLLADEFGSLTEALDYADYANEFNENAEFRVVNQTGEEVAA